MIIAGPCLFVNKEQKKDILLTIKEIKKQLFNYDILFRIKLWGGGTTPQKYFPGIGDDGIEILNSMCKTCDINWGTEVQDINHFTDLLEYKNCSFAWIGARSVQNYKLLEKICSYAYYENNFMLLLKRNPGMSIEETVGIYDICKDIHNVKPYMVERGIWTIDRQNPSKWAPDLRGVIQIKYERPDIFERLFVDCSHSGFNKRYVGDIYMAFKAIGVQHFMFECTHDGKSITDRELMISVEELKKILCMMEN